MRLLNVKGKLVNKNVDRYKVKWDGKCRSNLQFKVKKFFEKYWKNHIGVYEEFPVYGTKLKVDLINLTKKIAVESNGPQHDSFNKFFHNNSRVDYLNSIKRDMKKYEWLESNSIKLIEIEEKDLDKLSPQYILDLFGISIV